MCDKHNDGTNLMGLLGRLNGIIQLNSSADFWQRVNLDQYWLLLFLLFSLSQKDAQKILYAKQSKSFSFCIGGAKRIGWHAGGGVSANILRWLKRRRKLMSELVKMTVETKQLFYYKLIMQFIYDMLLSAWRMDCPQIFFSKSIYCPR